MIVITGASGHLGRQVVERLAAHLPAAQLGVSVRDPQKAADLRQRGIRVTHGDFTTPSTLAAAFDGAEQVLLISVNALGDAAIQQHANAIQAAKQAGAKRILYTSHQGASPTSAVAFARDHAATERLLQTSGVPFVSLRNGFYAESALYQLGGLKEIGRLALPEDGPVSWTARADLAEAAAATLTRPDLFDGVTPPLTADRALTFADIAGLAADILHRPVTRDIVSDADYRSAQLARGLPEGMVGMLASLFLATRNGEFNVTDPALERLLGRRPTPMADTLQHFLSQDATPPAHA